MKKNILLSFAFACVPGCGQMYYGYMRRGMSLALWFWGLVFLASLMGLGVLAIFLPVIWAYAFFDTFNIRNLTPEQQAAFGDDFIPNHRWLQQTKLEKLVGNGKAGKAAGLLLLLVGVLILYNGVFSRFLWFLRDRFPFMSTIVDAIPPLLVAAVVIYIGIRLVQGKSLNFSGGRDDSFSPFTGASDQGFPQADASPRPFEQEGPGAYTPKAGENGSNFYATPSENLVNDTEEPLPEPPPVPVPPTNEVVLTLGDEVAVAAPQEEAAPGAEAETEPEAEEAPAQEKPKKKTKAAKAKDAEKDEDSE